MYKIQFIEMLLHLQNRFLNLFIFQSSLPLDVTTKAMGIVSQDGDSIILNRKFIRHLVKCNHVPFLVKLVLSLACSSLILLHCLPL